MDEVFAKAARLMFTPTVGRNRMLIDGACIAIEDASASGSTGGRLALFAKMFKPQRSFGESLYWMGMPNINTAENENVLDRVNRDRRTWALLLASVAWRDFT